MTGEEEAGESSRRKESGREGEEAREAWREGPGMEGEGERTNALCRTMWEGREEGKIRGRVGARQVPISEA